MRKFDPGRMIQILANLGVIAGIAFLGYELRQNNESLRAQSSYNHVNARAEFFTILATDIELSALLVKAQSGEQLEPPELFRLNSLYRRFFTMWQWEFVEQRLGRIDAPVPVETWRAMFRESSDPLYSYPGIRDAWDGYRTSFTPEFVEFMDREVADPNSE